MFLMFLLCLYTCFVCLFSILCILCLCMVLSIVSSFVYSCLFPVCTSLPTTATGWKPNCSTLISYIIFCLFVCLSGGRTHLSSPTLSTLYLLVKFSSLHCAITGTDQYTTFIPQDKESLL